MSVFEVEAVFTVEAEDADAAYRALTEMLNDPATWREEGRACGVITGWELLTGCVTAVEASAGPFASTHTRSYRTGPTGD